MHSTRIQKTVLNTKLFSLTLLIASLMAIPSAIPSALASTATQQSSSVGHAADVIAGGVGPAVGPEYGPKAAVVSRASAHYRVSFWIMWGIAGAESGWGSGGSNIFGLLAGAEGVDTSSWKYASLQAAKLMRRLYDASGSWEDAMLQYSGSNYGLSHIRYMYSQQKPTI